ncbi:hypothetical protein ACWEPC_30960 [Nonomuraea sp. NPDC004297]
MAQPKRDADYHKTLSRLTRQAHHAYLNDDVDPAEDPRRPSPRATRRAPSPDPAPDPSHRHTSERGT